jgi:HEAT repeats
VEALSAADARVRAAALDALGSLPATAGTHGVGGPGPIARRLAAADPSIGVREAALRLLAKHDPKGARPLLVQALSVPSLRDGLRVTALELLAEEDDAPARTALLAWAQGGGAAVKHAAGAPSSGSARSFWARQAALRGLGTVAKGKAGRDLLLAAADDPNGSIRDAALAALAERREAEAIPALERLAGAESDVDRAAALRKTADALRAPTDFTQLQERVRQLEESQKGLGDRLEKVEERKGK